MGVDVHEDVQHLLPHQFLQRHLVDGERGPQDLPGCVGHIDPQDQALLGFVASVDHRLRQRCEVRGFQLRQETYVPEVDPQQWDVQGLGPFRGTQKGAVPPEDDRQLRRFPVDGFEICSGNELPQALHVIRETQEPEAGHLAHESCCRLQGLGAFRVQQHGDGSGFHGHQG